MRLIAALGLTGLLASTASAVVIYDAGAWPYAEAIPNPAWTGQFGNNAGAVAIAPDVIVTTRHQSGGVGTPVVFDGQPYKVHSELSSFAANIDLRVLKIVKPDNSPATLTQYTTLFTGNAGGMFTALVGWGASIGSALPASAGYNYNVHSPENAGPQLVGANIINGLGTIGSGLWTGTPVLITDFDGPSGNGSLGGGRVAYEAHLGVGDSGGGWYVYDAGVWKLAAVTHGIQDLTDATFGDQAFGVRLESYVPTINALIPEPTSLGFLTVTAIGLLRRRS